MDEMLTVRDVASRLNASTQTVYTLIRGGKIAAIRLGRNYRIPATEYERFATPQKHGETPRTQRQRIKALMRATG